MQRIREGFGKRLSGKQAGFTLVELLVVVGIIVGLAAAVVPRLSGFSGKGDEGARSSELQAAQTAVDTAMAEAGATALTGINNGTATASNDFSAVLDSGSNNISVTNYLRDNPTQHYYCYDTAGKVINETGGTALAASTVCPTGAY